MRAPFPALDARLSLALSLYDDCALAADIGTDHAYLPAALLQCGRCRRMILTDRSESALQNARDHITRLKLTDRVSLRQGDGLAPLTEPCDMISVTGLGGRTIRDMLLSGRDRLQGASLLLSAHTDLPWIREALLQLGYGLEREEPCLCAGHFYLVLRARPGGAGALSPRQVRLGGPLFTSASPFLRPYLAWQREILAARLAGLARLQTPDASQTARMVCLQEDIAFLDAFLAE